MGTASGPMDRARLHRRAVLAFGALGALACVLLAVFVFRGSVARQHREAAALGRHVVVVLDHELLLREASVDGIVSLAEELLAGRVHATVDVRSRLVARPEKGGYALGRALGPEPRDDGFISGFGPLPEAGGALAAELDMALALAPGFRTLAQRTPDVPWAYYVSRRGFLHLWPRGESDDFFFTEALWKEHFDHRAAHAHGQRTYWTELYDDRVGKGRVATVSKTVLHGGEVAGTVSVDVGMGTLRSLLELGRGAGATTLHLVNRQGTDMFDSAALPVVIDVAAGARGGERLRAGDRAAWVFPLQRADWFLVATTPERAIVAGALRDSLIVGLMMLFLLASVVLLLMLTRSLREVATLTVRDPLTGLYNRRHFDDVARAELAKARRGVLRFGVAIIDVDHFKKYNDRYGHHAGDDVLREVAGALRGALRRASDVVFRIGGEEFAAIVTLERPEQMRALGDILCAAVRALEIEHAGSASGRLTIAFGATIVEVATGTDFAEVYQRADAALYRAKAAGRDRAEVG